MSQHIGCIFSESISHPFEPKRYRVWRYAQLLGNSFYRHAIQIVFHKICRISGLYFCKLASIDMIHST